MKCKGGQIHLLNGYRDHPIFWGTATSLRSLLKLGYYKEEESSSSPKESISRCSLLSWRRNQARTVIKED